MEFLDMTNEKHRAILRSVSVEMLHILEEILEKVLSDENIVLLLGLEDIKKEVESLIDRVRGCETQ